MTESIKTSKYEIAASEYYDKYVDIDRFMGSCASCANYGRSWACPPYDFDSKDVWLGYEKLLLIAKSITLSESVRKTIFEKNELYSAMNSLLDPVRHELDDELFELEKTTPHSLALNCGGCDICKVCSRQSGTPCRFPEKCRHSIESMGGDVILTLRDLFGLEVEWAQNGRLPSHFVLMGGLLKGERY